MQTVCTKLWSKSINPLATRLDKSRNALRGHLIFTFKFRINLHQINLFNFLFLAKCPMLSLAGYFSFRHSRHKCVCDGIKNLVNYFNRINKDQIKVQFLLFSFWLIRSILKNSTCFSWTDFCSECDKRYEKLGCDPIVWKTFTEEIPESSRSNECFYAAG